MNTLNLRLGVCIKKGYDLYYTVIRNRDDKETMKDKYENNENEYINYDISIRLNQYIERKIDNVMLK